VDVQQVCEVIRYELIRRKISQRELERRYDWGHGYLSNVLSGRLDLKVKTLFQVLEAFELSPSEFFEMVQRAEEIHSEPRSPRSGRLVREGQMEKLFDLMVEAGMVAQELREQKEDEEPGEEPPRRSAGGRRGG